jgi:hypothetical protein
VDGLSQLALVAGARNHLNLLFHAPRLTPPVQLQGLLELAR